MVLRKLTADIEFTHWINEFFHKSSVYRFTKYAFFRLVVHYSQAISKSQIRLLLDKAVGKILFPSMMHLSLIGHIVSFS